MQSTTPETHSLRICRQRNAVHVESRRGGIMVIAMVCLVITTLILGSLLKMVTMHHTQMRYEQQRIQADWLAEAGLERAADKLTADPNYSGETWQIPAAEMGGEQGGSVQIAIEPAPGHPDQRIVSVAAIFPTETKRFAKRSKKVTVRAQAKP
jgi:hypothetical protein